MTTLEEQHQAYDDATSVKSDPFGIIDRDNRNHRKKQQILANTIAADPGDPVLEVGCGHGLHARHYDTVYDYTGIDLSESLVEKTNQLLEHGHALAMNAEDTDFSTDEFESVVGTAILHHMPNPGRALVEWTRITRPGGIVALLEPNYYSPQNYYLAKFVPEEENLNVLSWNRIRTLLHFVTELTDTTYSIEPRLYTFPWPSRLNTFYDRIDDVMRQVPVLRWASHMQLIVIRL